MSFSAQELEELRTGLRRFGVFFLLHTDELLRYWLGVGDIKPGMNAIDVSSGAVYKGLGEIIDVDPIYHLFDGTASRLTLSVSNVPESIFAEIAPSIAEQQAIIQGKEIDIGWCALDRGWQPIGPIRWDWFGFADLIRVRHTASESYDGVAGWSISLSCGDWLTGTRRAGLSFLADPDQRRRSFILNPSLPADRFAERTGLLSNAEKPWPPID